MAHVTAAAAVLTGEVVRVNRELSTAVGIVRGLGKDVISLKRDLRIQPAIETYDHLSLTILAARLVLIDIALRWIRPNTLWR